MSTLLNSLRRARRADTAAPLAPGGGHQAEAILSTLGYARRQRRKRVLRLAIGGAAVASIALLGWAIWGRSAAMPEAPRVAADLTVAGAEPGVPPAPAVDPVRAAALEPAGETVLRPVPDIASPVAALDQMPSDLTGETPGPPEDTVETPGPPEEAVETPGPPDDTVETPGPPEDTVETPGDRGGRSATVETGPGGEPSLALGTPLEAVAAGGPDDEVIELPLAPGEFVPPPILNIRRGPVVSEVFAAALAFQRAGDISGAVAEYQTLLAEGTQSAQVHNNLGLLYEEQHRLDDAAREFQRAIEVDQQHSKAHNNLGVVRMRQARHEDAAAAFSDARRLDGTNLDAWVNLALAQQAAGHLVAARRTLIDALSVDAQHAPAHYNLARLFELGGDASRAVEHYGRFVEHSHGEYADIVEIVRNRIAALGGRSQVRR